MRRDVTIIVWRVMKLKNPLRKVVLRTSAASSSSLPDDTACFSWLIELPMIRGMNIANKFERTTATSPMKSARLYFLKYGISRRKWFIAQSIVVNPVYF